MIYPLVRELAVDGVPVTVTCRVLKIARQPYYRWLANPVTDAEWVEAHLANALFDAHRDDPEFGYRFLLDEVRAGGRQLADRTGWRICSANGSWSMFGKRGRGKKTKPGAPPRPPTTPPWRASSRCCRKRPHREPWCTRDELRIAIVTRIERTYHRRRRQAALGRLTPIEYETIMTTPATQAA